MTGTAVGTTVLLRPVVTPAELVQAHGQLAALIAQALRAGTDYGVIPGTDRPMLRKPGAERLVRAFGCVARYEVVAHEADHDRLVRWRKPRRSWRSSRRGDRGPTTEVVEGESLGLYRYVIRCQIVTSDGQAVGEAIGSCSTMESRYVDRPRDLENTVLKMATKRALVAAVLQAFGLSDRFAPDVETPDVETPDGETPDVETPDGETQHQQVAEPVAAVVAGCTLPGPSSAWGGHGGQPLDRCPPRVLAAFVQWAAADRDRIRGYHAEVQEAERLLGGGRA